MSTSSPNDDAYRPDRVAGPSVRRVLRRCLRGFEAGSLTVELPNGERIVHRGIRPGREAVLVLHRWRALRRLATGGDVAFAEAYIDGDWSCRDLTALIELAAENAASLDPSIEAPLLVAGAEPTAPSPAAELEGPEAGATSRSTTTSATNSIGGGSTRGWSIPRRSTTARA